MLDLPLEIWLHIAKQLHSNDLRKVYGVNRALFHASMDHRWGEVIVETRNLSKAMHLLARLSYAFCPSQYIAGPN